MRALGLHLQQTLALVATPRPSAVAEIDPGGRLTRVALAGPDDEIAAALGPEPAIVAVDAPLAAPTDTGARDVERVLQWCDVALFPVSARRLAQVYGGHRAAALVPRLPPALDLRETAPDVALRLMRWLDATGGAPMDLADYRTRWLGVRAPRFRPRGPGRADATGVREAWELVAGHVDLGDRAPATSPDDWRAIADAAVIDAVACAWVAHLALRAPERVMRIGAAERGELTIPVDGNLRARVDLTLARMRAGREIAI